MDATNTIWTTGYTADGFRVSLTLDVDADAATVAALMAKLDLVRAAGITPNMPGLDAGQEKETIAVVMRRSKPADGTPIIDFYPEWSASGNYGAFKYGSLYLDNKEDIAQFEAQSGLRLADLPVYDGQQALKRTHGRPHDKEVPVKRAFDLVREKVGEHDSGHPKYTYSYFMPVSAGGAVPAAGDDDQSEPPAKYPYWRDEDETRAIVEDWHKTYGKDGETVIEFSKRVLALVSRENYKASRFSDLADTLSKATVEAIIGEDFRATALPRARVRDEVTASPKA